MSEVLRARFDEGTGAVTANMFDAAQEGVLAGPPSWKDVYTPAGDQYYLGFDNDDVVMFPEATPTKITGPITVAAWVKSAQSPGFFIGRGADDTAAEILTRGEDHLRLGWRGEPVGANLFTDGGIEAWDDVNTPTHWGVELGGASVVTRSEDEYEGTYAAEIDTNGSYVNVYASVNLVAGKYYRLSWRLKGTADSRANVTIRQNTAPNEWLQDDLISWGGYDIYHYFIDSVAYVEHSCIFFAEATRSVAVIFGFSTPWATVSLLDDIVIQEYVPSVRCLVRQSDDDNLVVAGSLEDWDDANTLSNTQIWASTNVGKWAQSRTFDDGSGSYCERIVDSYKGTYAIKMVRGTANIAIKQHFNLIAGKTYEWSFQYKKTGGDFYPTITDLTTSGILSPKGDWVGWVWLSEQYPNRADYYRAHLTFVAQSTGVYEMQFNQRNAGFAQIDDVQLRESHNHVMRGNHEEHVWHDSLIAGWAKDLAGGSTAARTSTTSHGGQYATKIVRGNDTARIYCVTPPQLVAGESWTFSLYHRESGASPLQFRVHDVEGNEDLQADGSFAVGENYVPTTLSATYIPFEIEFTAPSTGEYMIYIEGPDDGQSYWVDDVVIEKTATKNLIVDGFLDAWDDVNTLTHWTVDLGGAATLTRNTDSFMGLYTAGLQINNSWAELSQDVTLAAGEYYKVSWRHKDSTAPLGTNLCVRDLTTGEYLQDDYTWALAYNTLSFPVIGSDYYKLYCVFQAAGANLYNICFNFDRSGNDTLLIDDVEVRLYDPDTDLDSAETEVISTVDYLDDDWHRILARFDPASAPAAADGKFQLWVDGALKHDITDHGIDKLNASAFRDWWVVGGRRNVSTEVIDHNLEADIDHIRIWDEYVSDATIASDLLAPVITTQAVTDIDTTTATGNGNVTSLGIPSPTQHGVCWSIGTNPTTADDKTEEGVVGATGAFTSNLTGLTPGMQYHVRAYATSVYGTVYGADVEFTALKVPTVTTQAVTDLDHTTATGNGNITDLGVPDPTQHGVCWSLNANPTTADSKTEEGAAVAIGAFTSDITGLTPGTLYHVRAYATNDAGTVYGSDVTFVLSPRIEAIYHYHLKE